jgi:hypothetical protein
MIDLLTLCFAAIDKANLPTLDYAIFLPVCFYRL